MEGDPEAEVVRQAPQHRDQPPCHAEAEDGADERGAEVVGHAFCNERLREVEALHADGARHAHLGTPLSREHDEGQEDQHDAGRDRKEAEHEEERDEQRPRQLGSANQLSLAHRDLEREPLGLERRLETTSYLVAQIDGVTDAADRRHDDEVGLAVVCDNPAQCVERNDDTAAQLRRASLLGAAQRRRQGVVPHDAHNVQFVRGARVSDLDGIPRQGDFLREVLGDERLVRTEH